MTPEFKPVRRSSHVHSIAHDGDANDMLVKFASGATYRYHGVPAQVAAQVADAESPGTYIRRMIIPNHRYTKERE